MSSNWDKIQKRLGSPSVGASLSDIEELADAILDYIKSIASETNEEGLPIYTGNLFDSTGIGIYKDGSLIALKTNDRIADDVQTIGQYGTYFGADLLNTALQSGISDGGYVLRIISASPIAEMINEEGSSIGRGEGFWYDITAFAEQEFERRFKK